MKRNQSGFTLIELMISIVIVGIMLAIASSAISNAFTYMQSAKRNENVRNMQKLAGGLMNFAQSYNGGRLPAPYTGGTSFLAVYNPADVSAAGNALSMELRNTGIPVNLINFDSAAVSNVRVYQRVSGLTYTTPFYISSGPAVTLTYDVGSLTQTECGVASACNAAIPGDSVAMTAANVTTWIPAGTDYGGIVFSTLPAQKDLLRQTVGRMNRLSDRLASEFYTRMRLAAANSAMNFFPAPNNGGAPVLSGANPTTNRGCHDGWYSLNAANVNVLTQLGLDQTEFGVTGFGGSIQYCRDYEPTAVSGATANTPPHYAALRINRDLSAAGAPTGTATDVVVTF